MLLHNHDLLMMQFKTTEANETWQLSKLQTASNEVSFPKSLRGPDDVTKSRTAARQQCRKRFDWHGDIYDTRREFKGTGEQRQPNTFVLMYQHHTCHCPWYDLPMKAAQLDWLAWEHCFFRQNKIRVKQLLWISGV